MDYEASQTNKEINAIQKEIAVKKKVRAVSATTMRNADL